MGEKRDNQLQSPNELILQADISAIGLALGHLYDPFQMEEVDPSRLIARDDRSLTRAHRTGQ
jgi:hypothetical protein